MEEDNQINFIREKYKENKGIKFKNIFEKGVGGCDLYFCGAILVIATTVMILETTTLPFRIMSEPKERIEKEIKTLQSNKIGILPVENIYLVLIDSRSQDRILFEDNKAFVSFEDLKLNSFNRKNYSYKLFNGDNDKSILTGNLDFTEQIEANKELQASILANDTSFKSLKCQKEFPILLNQNLSKKDASLKLQEICINKHAKSTTFVWNNPEYKACLYSIKDCYKETDN